MNIFLFCGDEYGKMRVVKISLNNERGSDIKGRYF